MRNDLLVLALMIVMVKDSERSEEHTSELQSHLNLVCRLLLEKKKEHCLTQAAPNPLIPSSAAPKKNAAVSNLRRSLPRLEPRPQPSDTHYSTQHIRDSAIRTA